MAPINKRKAAAEPEIKSIKRAKGASAKSKKVQPRKVEKIVEEAPDKSEQNEVSEEPQSALKVKDAVLEDDNSAESTAAAADGYEEMLDDMSSSSETDEEGEEQILSGAESDSGTEDKSDEEEQLHFPEDHKVLNAQKKSRAIKTGPQTERGVVYLGRIPHGFYEDEMRAYFTQFGKVTRLRMSRNKKTGKSRHFAFIEFESADVADIVAQTMDNYLLFNHILKCQVVPKEKVHADLFKGANRKFKVIPWAKVEMVKHNKPKSTEQYSRMVKRLVGKEEKKRQKLKEMGIEYDFDGYSAIVKPSASAPTAEKEKSEVAEAGTKRKAVQSEKQHVKPGKTNKKSQKARK
ncbi:hypothetical protein BKA69DRAFT_1089816 [Paraphysoderma sedebokerense]|nr:hypothetical protein BKA69DRAFT_1089816 [Paraphysoderma sedebokerense]